MKTQKNIQQKPVKFVQILGILNNNFKHTYAQTPFRINVALSVLLYGSEIRNLRQKVKEMLTAAEIKLFRKTAECTMFDQKRNEDMLEEQIEEKLQSYQSNWLQHVTSIKNNGNKIGELRIK